jgi:MFS family permease
LAAVLGFANFAMLLLGGILWLQGHWHYSAIRTGFAMSPGPITFAIFAGVGETLQQKAHVPTRVITSVGYVIAAVGTVLFVVLTKENAGYAGGFLPAWLVVGVGVGLAMPLTISSATAELPPAQAATGSAIVTMATQIGSVIGISLLAALLGAASSAAALSNFHHAWWVGVGLALAAAVTSLGISKHRAVTS